MKVAISWVETTRCRAVVEVEVEADAMTLVKRLEVWGDVPEEVEQAKEEIDYSIDDADYEVESP